MASVATYLEKKGNFKNIKVIDATYDDLLNDTLKYKPDIIGIGAFTVHYSQAIKLANDFRKNSNAKIIIGGYHISTLPISFKTVFDIGVIGEGEQTMLELMKSFEKNHGFKINYLKKINGLVFFDKNKLIITEKRENIKSLDDIPTIDRKYTNQKYYDEGSDLAEWFPKVALIETARGCPYNCVFCSPSVFWGKTRMKSVENVVKEVKQLHEEKAMDFFAITDDLFICSKERIKKIVDVLEKENLLGKISFACFARANLMDDEICKLLKKMNVKMLSFGFESGSEKVLKYLKGPSISVEDNRRSILLCNKYGFLVGGNILLGNPGEKIEDMKKSEEFIDFCIKERTKGYMAIFVLTPFPGTPIWEIAKKHGKVSDDMDWEQLRLQNWERPLLLDDDVSIEEFTKIFREMKKKIRYFHRQVWMNKFKRSPLRTLKLLLSGGRIMKYLTIDKRTDI
ncbi:MAG: radical SAM protein [Nanoarchaeota archaeon]|nr:radical SAM protein [Nanoarchaeota archaeon]